MANDDGTDQVSDSSIWCC